MSETENNNSKIDIQALIKQKLASVEPFIESITVKRFIGTFIDMVLIAVPAVLIALPATLLLPASPVNFGALFNCLIFCAAAGLVLVKDMPFQFSIFDGQTPGKKSMHLRVTDLEGKPITMQMSIMRNIIPASPFIISALSTLLYVLPIPLIPGLASLFIILPLFLLTTFANLFELYKIYTGAQNRRWGDNLAGTIVIND